MAGGKCNADPFSDTYCETISGGVVVGTLEDVRDRPVCVDRAYIQIGRYERYIRSLRACYSDHCEQQSEENRRISSHLILKIIIYTLFIQKLIRNRYV